MYVVQQRFTLVSSAVGAIRKVLARVKSIRPAGRVSPWHIHKYRRRCRVCARCTRGQQHVSERTSERPSSHSAALPQGSVIAATVASCPVVVSGLNRTGKGDAAVVATAVVTTTTTTTAAATADNDGGGGDDTAHRCRYGRRYGRFSLPWPTRPCSVWHVFVCCRPFCKAFSMVL